MEALHGKRLSAALLIAVAVVAIALPGRVARGAGADPTAALTLRQLVGERIVYAYSGTRPPAALVSGIRRGDVAAVILFTRNIASRAALRATLRRLQSLPRPAALRAPLLVMIDQEGGLVKRLSGAPDRSPAQLGRIESTSLTRREGTATAANLRSVGANVNLAPVVDVGRPGSFQQRMQRSYSSNAGRAAAMAGAFVAGLRTGHVLATLKHFPGLGTLRGNEDASVQRVRTKLATLRRVDELPFAAGIRAGAAFVMTSTARYDAFGASPAVFSRAISTDELRGQLGFTGVAVTDDLDTDALKGFGSPARRALLAAAAGNDLLMFAADYGSGASAAAGLVREVRAGRLSVADLRASARRVLELRATLASH